MRSVLAVAVLALPGFLTGCADVSRSQQWDKFISDSERVRRVRDHDFARWELERISGVRP